MRVALNAILCVAAFLSVGHPLEAQTPRSDWAVLERILPRGTRVKVDLTKGRQIEGEIIEVTPSALLLSHKSKQTSVDRSEVVRVYQSVPHSSRRNAWIGAGVGAAIGASGVRLIFKDDLQAGATPAIGAIGAAVGALVGHLARKKFDWIEVYSRYG